MAKKFNVFTAGLPQILGGLAMIGVSVLIFRARGGGGASSFRSVAIVGGIGFVLLLWGLMGGSKDNSSY